MPANLENSAMATGVEKVSFHSNPKERQCQKCSDYYTDALISHASKVMFRNLQGRLQQHVNWELPDIQAGFRKRGIRGQIADICWITEKERAPGKHLLLLYSLCQRQTRWITTNCGKFCKRGISTTLPAFWEICVQVKKQQLELSMEQWTGSNWERIISRLYIFTLLF